MSVRAFPSAALTLAAVLVIACGDPSGSSDQSLGARMLGEWTHARDPKTPADTPSLSVGLSVSIVIDSAREMQFWGHVASWFAGDVGVPVNRFGPISGTIDSAYHVVWRIAAGSAPESSGRTLTIEGDVNGDLLTVHASWAGVEPGPFPQGCRFQRLQ